MQILTWACTNNSKENDTEITHRKTSNIVLNKVFCCVVFKKSRLQIIIIKKIKSVAPISPPEIMVIFLL